MLLMPRVGGTQAEIPEIICTMTPLVLVFTTPLSAEARGTILLMVVVGDGKRGGGFRPKPLPRIRTRTCSDLFAVVIFCVFLFGRPQCAVFPVPFVYRNMAELNVDDPSLWFNDVLAARDKDEAIVDNCYEAATDASDYAGPISGDDSDDQPEFCNDQPEQADRCRNPPSTPGVTRGCTVQKKGAEIGTLGPWAWLHVLILN